MIVNYEPSTCVFPHTSRHCHSLLIKSTIFLICIAFLLISCAPSSSSDPKSIVQGVFDSLNAGDVDGFMRYYADNAVMCSPGGCFQGAEEIRDKISSYMKLSRRLEISDMKSNGNQVTFVLKGFQGIALVETANDGLFIVVDGKVIFDGTEALREKECKRDASQAFCPYSVKPIFY